jgi:AraC-like DNA-binding protein
LLRWFRERAPWDGWPDFVVCATFDCADNRSPDHSRLAAEAARDEICRLLAPELRAVPGIAHTNAVYFCGRWPGPRDDLRAILEGMLPRLAQAAGAECTMGLAWLPEAGLSGLVWAAQRAVVAQRRKVRTGPGRVYVFDRDEPRVSGAGVYLERMAAVQRLVRQGERDAARAEAVALSRALFEDAYFPLGHLRPILQTHIILAAQAAIEAGADADEVTRHSENRLNEVTVCFDYGRLRALVEDAAGAFAALVAERFHSVAENLAAAADEFIEQRCADPELGLADIAAYAGCTPAHLSRTYKRVRGAGIARTINIRRVQRAMALLADPERTIAGVAFEVGFGSVQNLGRAFRRECGVSPSVWRRAKYAR